MTRAEEMGGVVVTGAARGIGFGIARSAAATGYGVVVADVDADTGKAAAARITAEGGRAGFVKVDVTDRAQVRAAIKECASEFGFLHGIVNNAGFNRPQPFLETTEENWTRIMQVNGLGVGSGSGVPAASLARIADQSTIGSPSNTAADRAPSRPFFTRTWRAEE